MPRVRVRFAKLGKIRWTSHRDIARMWERAFRRVGLPLQTVAIDDPKVCETYERPFVLIRPDGHVAWRGEEIPANAAAIIDKVRGAS